VPRRTTVGRDHDDALDATVCPACAIRGLPGAAIVGNTHFRNAELDAVIEKLEASDPTDPAMRPTFDQALDLFMGLAPAVPIVQTIYPMMYSTQHWTGWPTPDNPYTIPATWWSHLLFAIGSLQSAGGA
jgi:peptide/nickel transport system substrate-binding protein